MKKNLQTCGRKERGTLFSFSLFFKNIYLFKILLDLGFLVIFIYVWWKELEKNKSNGKWLLPRKMWSLKNYKFSVLHFYSPNWLSFVELLNSLNGVSEKQPIPTSLIIWYPKEKVRTTFYIYFFLFVAWFDSCYTFLYTTNKEKRL